MTAFSYPASGPVGGFFIGLMSGTSLDGVDGVLVEISTTGKLKALLAHQHLPFDAVLREELLALQTPGDNELHRAALAGNALAAMYAEVVEALLGSARVERDALVCIGAHGQTVRHRPDLGYTWQINNPARLAELSAIPVVADFRSRDVAAGGQGRGPWCRHFTKPCSARPTATGWSSIWAAFATSPSSTASKA